MIQIDVDSLSIGFGLGMMFVVLIAGLDAINKKDD